MKKKAIRPTQGSIIVSEPFLLDSYFKRAVILLGEHDDFGSIGFILNKPTEVSINDAVDDFPEFNAPLYFGGPVDTDILFYIHTLGPKLEGAKEILNGVYWGGNYDQLRSMIDTKQVKPHEIRFYAGYSGWEPKQLNIELREKSWIFSPTNSANPALVKKFAFFEKPKDLWGQVLKSMGTEYAILSNFPEDPSLN